MHIDIYGSFNVNSFKKERYFVTFIDDYSRYDYVYLKISSSGCLKNLFEWSKKTFYTKAKDSRSIGGEYYERYDESWQYLGLFAKFLKKCDI